MTIYALKNNAAVGVIVDGQNLGIFDVKTGGEFDSSERKYSPGGMAPQISLGGKQNFGNVVVSRIVQLERDMPLIPFLRARTGKSPAAVVDQPLDRDGNLFGAPIVYVGTLKRVTPPERDSNSESEEARLELEITVANVA